MVHAVTSGEHSNARSGEVSLLIIIFFCVIEALTIVSDSAHLSYSGISKKRFCFGSAL